MSINIDKILELIDVGLQRTSEPNMESIERDRCARCQMGELEGDGDLCQPCRAYLLGDEDDPMKRRLGLPLPIPSLPLGSGARIVFEQEDDRSITGRFAPLPPGWWGDFLHFHD